MRDLTAYIDSLLNGDVAMSEKEWLAWIAKEEKDYGEKLTDEEKAHIISELEAAGLVKEAEDMISLTEWAKLNGIDPATARQRALRGAFTTARKIGRNWVIDKNEPLVDHRRNDK